MDEITFCERCNIEHPPINGIMSNEIVRGSYPVNYRGLTFEIWLIENPNRHFWAWVNPTGKTKGLVSKILYGLGCSIPLFNEGYYMAGYIFREEKLKTKELALEDAKEALIDISKTITDDLIPE